MRRTQADYRIGPSQGSQQRIARALRDRVAWLSRVLQLAVEADDPGRRCELAHAIRHHWHLHARAQERCVYWLLEDHTDAKNAVISGRRAHARIGLLVQQLFEQDTRSGTWCDAARALAAALEDHAQTEECELLPRLSMLLDRRESAGLGGLYEQLCAGGNPPGAMAAQTA